MSASPQGRKPVKFRCIRCGAGYDGQPPEHWLRIHERDCEGLVVSDAELKHLRGAVELLREAVEMGPNTFWPRGQIERWLKDSKSLLAALGQSVKEPSQETCGRLLVGQGSDTWDPLCVLAAGHEGRCQAEEPSHGE